MRLQILEEENALAPVVDWHNEPDRGYNAVQVCTWDRGGLFSKIAGSLSAAGLVRVPAERTLFQVRTELWPEFSKFSVLPKSAWIWFWPRPPVKPFVWFLV